MNIDNNNTVQTHCSINVTHCKGAEDERYDVKYAEYAVTSMLDKEIVDRIKRLANIQLTDDEKCESISKSCGSLINQYFLERDCRSSHAEIYCSIQDNNVFLKGKVAVETYY